MNPLISIIMPAYNAAEFIEEAILSAQAQTYTNWELIVVDDGSVDQTVTIVKGMAGTDPRIIYIYQHNQKLGAARNTGINAAKGEWLAYLDADDLWMPEKLEKQLQAADEYNAGVVYTGGYILKQSTGQLIPYDNIIYGLYAGVEMYKKLYVSNYVPVLAVMMKRSITLTVGLQDTDPAAYGCEDYDYWLRIAKSGAIFYGMKIEMFKYRVHGNAMSRNGLLMAMSKFFVLYKNLDPAIFTKQEIVDVDTNLLKRVRDIIPKLYDTGGKNHLVPYYLDAVIKLKGGLQLWLAKVAYQLLKAQSKDAVLFFLLNRTGHYIKRIPQKIKGNKKLSLY